MHAKDLHTVWSAPDNSRLTAKQFSFRLPVHVAAKIAALCELYPQKSRTQIVGDLLSTALAELEKHLPSAQGTHIERIVEERLDLYEEVGEVARFRGLANKHYKELEGELGNEAPDRLYGDGAFIVSEEFEE